MKHSSKKGVKGKDHSRAGTSSSTPSGIGGNSSSFKGKETRLSKALDSPEECALSFPDLKIIDKNKLPCYSSILNKSKEDMIGMDDLDTLQLELESILSAVSFRIRELQGEITTLSNVDDQSKDKKVKLISPIKTEMKKEEKPLLKVSKPVRDVKSSSSPSVPAVKSKSKSTPLSIEQDVTPEHPIPELGIPSDPTKVTVPKNDTPNKFWAFVENYCAEITGDDVKFLEDLISSCEKDADILKIPPLGKHYTLRWAEEDLADERDGSSVKLKKKSSDTGNASSGTTDNTSNSQAGNNNNAASATKELLKKAAKLCSKELVPGPLAQRLISALLEEHTSPLQDSGNKLKVEKVSDQDGETPSKKQKLDPSTNTSSVEVKGGENAIPNYIKKLPLYHTSVCFERRIRRGLEAAGFLDTQPPPEENDEILKEIKKCQEELRSCAVHNVTQLKHSLKLAQAEVARNQVRKKLRQTDVEIVEMYRHMTAAKLKKKQITTKEREQAWKLLKDRESLLKHFESLPSGLLI